LLPVTVILKFEGVISHLTFILQVLEKCKS
jgi:hypothetical protein